MESEMPSRDLEKDSLPIATAAERATFSSILEEHDVARQQRERRIELLRDLEHEEHNDSQKSATLGFISHEPLTTSDIPVLGNVLLKLGDVHTLNLILHSPGGDGTVVETFVALCRTYCKRFRVIIPTAAKSAATLIALGTDEIVMGPPSEIGPIDAQVPILVSGTRRYVLAQSFIDARDNLLARHSEAVAEQADTSAILQMIASLDLPFIVECERLMEFGRDVGHKMLCRHMFARSQNRDSKAHHVVNQLSSVELHKVHGRTIDGASARRELSLKVRLCGSEDEFWQRAWEWYTRAEIHMARIGASRIFETRHESLAAIRGPAG